MKVFICFIIIAVSIYLCKGYKILVMSPFPSKSHAILGDAYVKILLEAGHEITYITAVPKNNTNPLLHQIDVSENEKLLPPIFDVKKVMNKEIEVNAMKNFLPVLLRMCEATIKNPEVTKILSDVNQTFDVIIIEWMFHEVYSGLSAVLDCPYIWFSTMEPHWMILNLIDEASSPAYTSSAISYNSAPFTFTERVQEIFHQMTYFVKDWYLYSTYNELYTNLFDAIMKSKGKTLPSFNDVRFNASLVLGNSHASLGQAIKLPQNYKPIAGYHIETNVKQLPEDLKTIMDKATDGVIYYSMGSIVNSRDLPEEIKKKLINVFGRLKQTVLLKFQEDIPNLPKNIHILQWAPQQSILSHPNCIMFISHGGLLSITEAVHFGVPIIGIPVFGDQYINVQRAVNKGFATQVDLSHTMVEDLDEAIQELLNNQSYRMKVKDLSFVYHHRPVSPAKEIVHWVEHVVQTKGAKLLQSPALNVPLYEKLYLDLLAAIAAIVTLSVFSLKYILQICFDNKQSRIKKMN